MIYWFYYSDSQTTAGSNEDDKADMLYHLTLREDWDAAKASNCAYFPKKFEVDGFTHATSLPNQAIEVANHFYQVIEIIIIKGRSLHR